MAPEYALWGYLTFKADVYSFGIVALEIVAGKNNTKYRPEEDYVCLQDRVRYNSCFKLKYYFLILLSRLRYYHRNIHVFS